MGRRCRNPPGRNENGVQTAGAGVAIVEIEVGGECHEVRIQGFGARGPSECGGSISAACGVIQRSWRIVSGGCTRSYKR